jgi:hypothetical protein
MPMPTDADIKMALTLVATPLGDGWQFHRGDWHTIEQAEDIARACLALGLPVADVFTSKMASVIVTRLITLEDRVARVESGTTERARRIRGGML